MKETINVNIAQQAFTMDMDAYSLLTTYLNDIGRRLSPSDTETLADIEARIAEIFREKVPSPMMVINYATVSSVIHQIGEPKNFGCERNPDYGARQNYNSSPRQLYRSSTDRSLAGVCSGLGSYFNIDTMLVRVIFIVGVLAGMATGILYFILWIAIPEEPTRYNFNQSNRR